MTQGAQPKLGTAGHPVRIGTRNSLLARTQTEMVADDLRQRGLVVEIVPITTEGDINPASLKELGGIGVFAAELRLALLHGRCDLAVHSFKDLPTAPVEGLTIAAVPARAGAGDVLVAAAGLSFAQLPAGARVGTGSPRRAAQLLAVRPDLEIIDIRGNVGTRLARVRGIDPQEVGGRQAEHLAGAVANALPHPLPVGDLDAVILARAGLERLGLGHFISDDLSPEPILPAPAQGALAIECREADLHSEAGRALASTLRYLDDLPTRLCASAEREVLRYLEAGCAAPIGTLARLDWAPADHSGTRPAAGTLELSATVVSLDGRQRLDLSADTTVLLSPDADARDFALSAAQELGVALGAELLAGGAAAITDLHAAKAPRRGQ